MTDAFDVYVNYIAIKLTFDMSNSYDYLTYGGRINHSRERFNKRKDKYQFYTLAKKLNFDGNVIENYLFINLVYNPDYWIGNLLSQECMERYNELWKYQQSFMTSFENELESMKREMDKENIGLVDVLSAKSQPPKIMEWVYAEMFSPMLLHGLNRVFGVFDKWKKNESIFEPLLWEPMKRQEIFQNFAFRFSHRLTKKILQDSIKEIIKEEE